MENNNEIIYILKYSLRVLDKYTVQVKKSRDIIKRTGMPTTLIISKTDIKTTIFEVNWLRKRRQNI